MNFFKRPSSANIPDKILGEQERFLMGRVFVPLSEITTENEACANGPAKPAPIDTREVAPAVEANSDMPLFDHIVPDPHVSTIPGDEASIPSSSFKETIFVWWQRHRHLRDAESGDRNCRRRRVVADGCDTS